MLIITPPLTGTCYHRGAPAPRKSRLYGTGDRHPPRSQAREGRDQCPNEMVNHWSWCGSGRASPCGALRGCPNGAWLHQVVGTKVHRVLHRGFGRVLPLCGPRPNGTLTQGGCKLSTYGDGGTSCTLRVLSGLAQWEGLPSGSRLHCPGRWLEALPWVPPLVLHGNAKTST